MKLYGSNIYYFERSWMKSLIANSSFRLDYTLKAISLIPILSTDGKVRVLPMSVLMTNVLSKIQKVFEFYLPNIKE